MERMRDNVLAALAAASLLVGTAAWAQGGGGSGTPTNPDEPRRIEAARLAGEKGARKDWPRA